MTAQLQSILKVLKLAGRLKFELRHSYTSSGRRERVAEHTWRMSTPLLSKPGLPVGNLREIH
jgi:putative hydrolase of HD superfamily